MTSATNAPFQPTAPSPRADGPITEEEVLEWAERFEQSLHEDDAHLSLRDEKEREKRALFFDRSVVEALERSADLLLQKSFRYEFSELLFGDLRLSGRGFRSDSQAFGGDFLRRWRLLGVVPPAWDEPHAEYSPEPRYVLLAPFHVPIVAPSGSERQDERSMLERSLRCPSRASSRPPAPIEEHEVHSWAENIRAELHAVASDKGWRPPNPRLSPEQWFYSMEQSIDLMFNSLFRKDLTEVLYGKTDYHDHGYGLEDAKCRRLLRLKWGVTEVTPAEWDSEHGRYPLLTPLSVPWIPWAPRRKGSRRHFNQRLQLIHRDELNFHPHYLLTCAECENPQGAFVPLNWIEDAGPEPRQQVASILANRTRPSWRSGLRLKRLAEDFSEEILGFDASHQNRPQTGFFVRCPRSGPISEVLDWAMGFYDHPEFPQWRWPVEVMAREERRAFANARLLAPLLSRLQCQVCREIGALRYYPTFTYPVGGDLDPSAQGDEVKRLAKVFQGAKARVVSNKLFGRLLVFPDEIPRQRLVQIWKRAELRHEDAIRDDVRRPNLWLVAMWVVESLSAWSSLCERVGFGQAWRGIGVGADLEQQYRQLMELQEKLMRRRATTERLPALVMEAKRLLETEEFAAAAELLAEHHQQEKLDADLGQYRFRTKMARES